MSEVCDFVAPRSDTTLDTVIGIWERVLQRAPVMPDDNFFDLGGDSLLAIQLFAELDRVCGRQLPITTIYDASTAADLAELLRGAAPRPPFSPLVLLNEGAVYDERGEPSVFLIHGIGGNVMELTRLGKSIDPRRRVFAIQARGLDGIEAAIDSIPEMADYYLEAVRREQPRGPYLLVGYSFGGMVAMEMAHRIEASGDKVAFLGVIDSYPHPRYWTRISWIDVRLRRIAFTVRTRLRASIAERLSGLIDRGDSGGGRGGAKGRRRPFMFDDDWPEAVKRVYDTSLGALAEYRPAGYPGSIAFFRAGTRSFYLPDRPERIWRGRLGKLEVVTVPGDHVEMVGLNAATLGGELAARIASGLDRLRRVSA